MIHYGTGPIITELEFAALSQILWVVGVRPSCFSVVKHTSSHRHTKFVRNVMYINIRRDKRIKEDNKKT